MPHSSYRLRNVEFGERNRQEPWTGTLWGWFLNRSDPDALAMGLDTGVLTRDQTQL